MKQKKDRRMCRALSWVLLALLVMIIFLHCFTNLFKILRINLRLS